MKEARGVSLGLFLSPFLFHPHNYPKNPYSHPEIRRVEQKISNSKLKINAVLEHPNFTIFKLPQEN